MPKHSLQRGHGAAGLLLAWLLFHASGARAADREQLSVTLQLTAPDVAAAATRLRAVLAAHPSAEQLSFLEQDSVSATIRVPPSDLTTFVDAAAGVATVARRELNRTDVTQQLDSCARSQRELRAELDRLERAKANDADEAIRLADAVRQRRSEAASYEDECRLTIEGTDRATISIFISSSTPTPHSAEPHFFPGVRFSHLFNAGGAGTSNLFSLGLSAQFAEYVTFEVDLFRAVGTTGTFLDGMVMSAGFDTGSALLGKRRFFSPHLGLRIGVSALTGRVDLATGITAGITFVRLKYFQLDAQVRLWGFFGNRAGAHLGVQSGVVASVGF